MKIVSSKIAGRYAQALFRLSKRKKAVDKTYKEIAQLRMLVAKSGKLSRFLRNPEIPAEKRIGILTGLFEKRLSKPVFEFLLFLEHKNRLGLLEAICQIFEKLYHEHAKMVPLKITSARELSPAQVKTISKALKMKYWKDMLPTVSVDSDLVAGFLLQIEDTITDYSVKHKLHKFKKQILAV